MSQTLAQIILLQNPIHEDIFCPKPQKCPRLWQKYFLSQTFWSMPATPLKETMTITYETNTIV